MGTKGSVQDLMPRWSVDLPTHSASLSVGKQTFIVSAHTFAEAVEAAWEEAHTPRATRHRNGAALVAQRPELHACMLSASLF